MGSFLDDVLGFDPNGGGIYDLIDDVITPFGIPIKIGQEGLKWLQGALTPDIQKFGDIGAQDRSVLVNTSSNVARVPVIYGSRRVGGNRIFSGVSGANNEYLWMVFVLSEGEIAGIDNIYIDDVVSTDARFGSTVLIKKYVGTDTQTADPDMVSAFPGVWTASHSGKGCAYIAVRLTFDANIYDRLPEITADVRGRKVLDLRDALVKFTSNPALCIYDYLTNARYGKGIAAAQVDAASFIASANYCETPIISYSGGPNINALECNGVVDAGQEAKRNVEEMLTSCRGFLPYSGGKYKLVIDRDAAAVMDFNVDNLIGGWSIGSGSKRVRLNRAKAKFTNPLKAWAADLAIIDSPILRGQDNGLLLDKEFSFPFETSYYRALYHTEVLVKRSRQGLTCSFLASPEALKVEIADIVSITHATPGWVAKPFRVTGITLRTDGLVAMSCQEHESTAYDRAVPVEAATAPDTNLPDPRNVPAPASLTPSSGSSELIKGGDGTIISRVKAVWPVSNNIYVIGSDLEYKKSTDSVWLPVVRTASRNDVTAHISPVQDGDAYDLRVRYQNSMGFYGPYFQISNYVVIGKTEPPPPPLQFFISSDPDGTRRFTWAPPGVVPNDLAGYNIRYKLGSGALWSSMAPLHQGPLTTSPYETNQLAAGIYTFAIVTVDTTGNESSAVYIEATLGHPRLAGALEVQQSHLDGWPGIKLNCWVDAESGWLLASDTKTWGDFPTDGVTWQTWTQYTRSPSTLTYTAVIIDVGAVIKFTPLLSAEYSGTGTLEIRTSTDNVIWSGWATPAGIITTRYIQARVTVAPIGNTLTALKIMTLILDSSVISEDIADLVMSGLTGAYRLGVGDVRLPITKVYGLVRKVDVALQNVGPGWSWEIVGDKNIAPGPRIKVYNASNVLADAVIDATIRGV